MNKFRPLDAVVFAFALLIIGGFSYFAYTQPKDNAVVYIKTENGEWTYPLGEDRELELEGPLGSTRVEISRGEVLVRSSPCREKICIAASPISRPGAWLACLPNRIFIRIEGTENEEIDASTF